MQLCFNLSILFLLMYLFIIRTKTINKNITEEHIKQYYEMQFNKLPWINS